MIETIAACIIWVSTATGTQLSIQVNDEAIKQGYTMSACTNGQLPIVERPVTDTIPDYDRYYVDY